MTGKNYKERMRSLSAHINRTFIGCKMKPKIILRLLTLLIGNRLPYADQRLMDSKDTQTNEDLLRVLDTIDGRGYIQVDGEGLVVRQPLDPIIK